MHASRYFYQRIKCPGVNKRRVFRNAREITNQEQVPLLSVVQCEHVDDTSSCEGGRPKPGTTVGASSAMLDAVGESAARIETRAPSVDRPGFAGRPERRCGSRSESRVECASCRRVDRAPSLDPVPEGDGPLSDWRRRKEKGPLAVASGPSLGRKRPRRAAERDAIACRTAIRYTATHNKQGDSEPRRISRRNVIFPQRSRGPAA